MGTVDGRGCVAVGPSPRSKNASREASRRGSRESTIPTRLNLSAPHKRRSLSGLVPCLGTASPHPACHEISLCLKLLILQLWRCYRHNSGPQSVRTRGRFIVRANRDKLRNPLVYASFRIFSTTLCLGSRSGEGRPRVESVGRSPCRALCILPQG